MTDFVGTTHLDGISAAAKVAGLTDHDAEKIIAAYLATRGWAAQVPEPITHLVWLQHFNGIDEVHDYYEVARPGDKCIDGSPPFPVWGTPFNLYLSADQSGDQIKDSKEISIV